MSENPYQPYQQQHSQEGQYGSYGAGGHVPAAPPAYGYDATSQEANSAATMSLVFGILAVVLLPIVFGPLAVWQAKKAERLGKPATAGKVLGWIGIVMVIIGIIAGIAFVVLMASAPVSSGI
jgi:uncharacterized Tic20 family protein